MKEEVDYQHRQGARTASSRQQILFGPVDKNEWYDSDDDDDWDGDSDDDFDSVPAVFIRHA